MVLLAALNIWQFSYTDARAGTALVFLLLAGMWMIRYPWVKQTMNALPVLRYSSIICVFVTLFITWLYMSDPSGLQWMDKLLTGRLTLQRAAIQNFGIHLLGQRITWIGNGGTGYTQTYVGISYNYVDSAYIKILLDQGILVWLMVVLGFSGLNYYAGKKQDHYLLFAMAVLGIYFTVEQWMINPGYNPFFVLLWIPLFQKHVVEDNSVYNVEA